jgi:capsular polysaccharide export protein
LLYELTEFGIRQKIRLDNNKKYFLCILQVHNDFQVTHNSKYDSIETFIEEVMLTFHQFTQDKITNDCLIIKHHPMDIGEKNYKKLIQYIMKQFNMSKDSVVYIHNFRHLPNIYNKIKGGIMINSTFGLKLLTNHIPVINLSTSFYHKAGLTFQGSLLEFFNTNNKVNKRLVHNYLNHLIVRSQVNGCLYSKEYEIE